MQVRASKKLPHPNPVLLFVSNRDIKLAMRRFFLNFLLSSKRLFTIIHCELLPIVEFQENISDIHINEVALLVLEPIHHQTELKNINNLPISVS